MSKESGQSFDNFLEGLEKRARSARAFSIAVTVVIIAIAALTLFFTIREVKRQIEGARQEYSTELAKLNEVKEERAKLQKELDATREELNGTKKELIASEKENAELEPKAELLKKIEPRVDRQILKQAEDEIRNAPNKFAIIASRKTMEEAMEYARQVKAKGARYPVEVDQREPNRYAITLGGNLTAEEAKKRVEYARRQGIAQDAYVRAAQGWGKK